MIIDISEFRKSQEGNIFLIVLVGIVLFAGLSFTISRSMRSESVSKISDREVRLASTEIIEYGARIERAVSRLRRKGCSENEISFEGIGEFMVKVNGEPLNLENPDAPEDFICHIFHPDGAGVIERFPALEKVSINPRSLDNNSMDPRSMQVTTTRVLGHGSDEDSERGTDLVLIIGRLSEKACQDINDALEIDFTLDDEDPETGQEGLKVFDNPPVDNWSCDSLFRGEFSDCSDPIGDRAEILQGRNAFCVDRGDRAGENRHYVHVLIAR
ncbi:MAG: hypothetical protein AAF182_03775 [Pseudomonadota bacterium]